jgi:prevent-host-death family protein
MNSYDTAFDAAIEVAHRTNKVYSRVMASIRVPFTEVRQNLTSLVDEVEKFGRAITIVRRGKPAAVIIDHDTYRELVEGAKRKKWTLKGSISIKPGVDIDKELAKAKAARIRAWKNRIEKLDKLIRES